MIKYKDYEIDETKDIFNLTPEEVFRYANALAMTKKRKKKFMELYDIFKQNGVTNIDVSDDNKVKFTFNGDIDLSDKIGSEVAGYVVDYLDLGLRKKYGTQSTEKKEEEVKLEAKKDIPLYTNESFQKGLQEQIVRDYFKGRKNFDFTTDWEDALDKRNEETGLYSTEGRARVFSDQLRNYANSLKEDSYKFDETTPFKSLDEFKSALNSAANKLQINDLSGLNDIGFSRTEWFKDRGDDPVVIDTEGNTGKAKDVYPILYKLKQEEVAKQLKEKLKAEALENYKKTNYIYTINNVVPQEALNKPQEYEDWLAKTYGTGEKGYNAVNSRINTIISEIALNGKTTKSKELGNLLHYITTNNKFLYTNNNTNIITLKEYDTLKRGVPQIGKMNQVYRLPFIDPFGYYTYYDKEKGRFYRLKPKQGTTYNNVFMRGQNYLNYKKNFLKEKLDWYSTKVFLEGGNMPNSNSEEEGLPLEAKDELWAIGLDALALADPEPVSGTIAALAAAGFREKNRKWNSLRNVASGAVDWLSAGLGGIPILGDFTSGVKVTAKLGNYLHKYGEKAAIWIGGLLGGGNAAYTIVNKLYNNEPLTNGDMQNLIIGLGGAVAGLKTRNYEKARKAYMNAPTKKINKKPVEPKVDTWFTTGGITRPSWKRQKENLNSTWKAPSFISGKYEVNYKKQGGIIDKQRILKYKEYIRK